MATRHFLAPMLDRPDVRYVLRHARTGLVLASDLEQAFDAGRRRQGLLGRRRLAAAAALILAPCGAIHTFFMRFPIDVVFARRDGEVVKVCARVRPWRTAFARGSFAAIELASGRARDLDIKPGDRLELGLPS
jgi:uncharacterized membrane protein (UPF0127 family)